MVFDQELSRIGLAPKRSQYCRSNTDTLVTVGDNDIARLVLGIVYLLVALGLSVKVSVGWMQFYDVNLVAYLCRKKSQPKSPTAEEEQKEQQEVGDEPDKTGPEFEDR